MRRGWQLRQFKKVPQMGNKNRGYTFRLISTDFGQFLSGASPHSPRHLAAAFPQSCRPFFFHSFYFSILGSTSRREHSWLRTLRRWRPPIHWRAIFPGYLVKTLVKLLPVMAQVWILVVLSVKLSALGLANMTLCLRSMPLRKQGQRLLCRREFGKETGDS